MNANKHVHIYARCSHTSVGLTPLKLEFSFYLFLQVPPLLSQWPSLSLQIWRIYDESLLYWALYPHNYGRSKSNLPNLLWNSYRTEMRSYPHVYGKSVCDMPQGILVNRWSLACIMVTQLALHVYYLHVVAKQDPIWWDLVLQKFKE